MQGTSRLRERSLFVRLAGGVGNSGQARSDTRRYLWSLRKSTTGWLIDAHMFNSDH